MEDYEPTRGVMAATLRELYPDFARDGEEALIRIGSAAYDAYVVDQWLPDYSGILLCRDIRRLDLHVSIVFFTVADREEMRDRAMKAGATACLTTTVDYSELREQIANLIAVSDGKAEPARNAADEALAALRRLGRAADKAQVRDAYVAAGGTLSRFERWWSELAARR
ncbi:MAG TPA: response regulator [Burkholderiales bacterium]|nr:response regulator [Burkholderiales bacterium]